MSGQQIVRKNPKGLAKIKRELDNLKIQNKEICMEINDILVEETKEEKKDFEEALEKYNTKMKAVFDRADIREKLEDKYKCEDKIYGIVDQVQRTYKKAVKSIMDQPISMKDKEKKIIKLQEKIQTALINDEERKLLTILRNQIHSVPYKSRRLLM